MVLVQILWWKNLDDLALFVKKIIGRNWVTGSICPDRIRRQMTERDEETYSVGRVSRLTGVSPDLLRAWERRYAAVQPIRTPGGTRRYRAEDIDRLRLLKAAVDSGHRIGEVAKLSSAELERRILNAPVPERAPIEEVLHALERLDGGAAEQLISSQLAMLGPVRFAKEFALPLAQGLGDGWMSQRICIASEHLGSALLRSLLGSALRPTVAHRGAPVVVFATVPDERHEIGLLIAALTALGAGANPLYLGSDLPLEEIVLAARRTGAQAVAIGAVVTPPDELTSALLRLRAELPARVELWVGGAAARSLEVPHGVQRLDSLTRLEQRVELLRMIAA